MESVAPRAIESIVSANLIWSGVPLTIGCDVCAHEWKCPNPTVHELTGYCADCEIWHEILEEHIEECAVRCAVRWHMSTRASLGRLE